MADRLTEKKESESDNNWVPVVTPDRSQNAEDRQQQRQFNPRDYKTNTRWINPYSFLGETEQPKQETTPKEAKTTAATFHRRRKTKMTDVEKTNVATAKELKDEMKWDNKPNKTPTIKY